MLLKPKWRHVVGSLTIAIFAFACSACGDDGGTEPAPASTSTTRPTTDGTSIDRSNVPPCAAPGDGSGQNKTPEGNSNSGDSPTGTLTK